MKKLDESLVVGTEQFDQFRRPGKKKVNVQHFAYLANTFRYIEFLCIDLRASDKDNAAKVVKTSNVEAIESVTGAKLDLVANEQSLPMSQKRKEKYD
mgnify:CR=1 FL=1